MLANTEPIFIRTVLNKLVRLQSGSIQPANLSVGFTGAGAPFINCREQEHGALITDLWCQPIGSIGAGNFLRFFLTDYDSLTINLLFETTITTSGSSPFVRQDLGSFLPEVLSPTQTGIAGKKKGLYIAGNQELTLGLSADLAGPLIVGCQGGYY